MPEPTTFPEACIQVKRLRGRVIRRAKAWASVDLTDRVLMGKAESQLVDAITALESAEDLRDRMAPSRKAVRRA